jgi:P27 family predicted phage terminase small subunit
MRPPRGLDPAGKRAWQHAHDVLVEIGEVPQLSVGAVERYARAAGLAERLRAEWESVGAPGTVTGSRGAVREHPLLLAIARAEAQVADLGDRLGLTPVSRGRLGRTVGRPAGAASAADRRSPSRRTLRKVVELRPDAS